MEVTDPHLLPLLAPFHQWQDEVVEERFRYDDKQSISLAFVRVYRLAEPMVFPDLPRYGGCRSWVELPDLPAGTEGAPVLAEEAHRARENALQAVLNTAE